jgi:chromosome segregation ATPase
VQAEREGRRNEELLSTAGSILGGLLGGRRSRGGMLGSILGKAGSAAGRRSRTSTAGKRVEAAQNKIETLHQQLEQLEAELADDITTIDAKWMAAAKNVTTVPISLERTDVKVTQLALIWVPVA